MAGSPKKAAMLAELARRTTLEFPDDPEATMLDYVCRWQASAKTGLKLAEQLGVSWELIKDTLDRRFGREHVNNLLSRARESGAFALVDESLGLADEVDEDNVQVKRLQIQTKQWVAEKWNARELGAKSQAGNVTINLGTLMLQALQQPPPPNPFAIASVIVDEPKLLSDEVVTSYEVEHSIADGLVEAEGIPSVGSP